MAPRLGSRGPQMSQGQATVGTHWQANTPRQGGGASLSTHWAQADATTAPRVMGCRDKWALDCRLCAEGGLVPSGARGALSAF